MSKLARTISAAVLVGTALMTAPSGAGAATTIGETFAPTGDFPCFGPRTRLQADSPVGQYTVPTDGVITQWNFQAPPAATSQMKFKVGRPTGNPNEFTMIGESAPLVTPTANILNSYFTRIPVKTGDVIGNYNATDTNCARPGGAVYTTRFINGDVVPPTTAVFPFSAPTQLDISPLLEPDCDKDGLGDETQDTNLSSCAPGTTPPPTGTPPPGSPPGTPPVTCKGLVATVVGTNGSDARTGSLGQDVIAGLGGNDTLSGIAGNDVICGGGGKDLLKGGKGNDKLYGQKGNDALKGGGGNDVCKGGKGKDTLSSC
jgi:hypothetical protein